MRGGAADRIGRLDADREVDIGAIGTESVVAGKVQLGTRLPLSVSRRDDAIRQRRVQLCPRSDAAARRLDRHPIALTDIPSGRRPGADFGDRVGLQPAQPSQVAVLAMAVGWGLRRRQRERKTSRISEWPAELGQGRFSSPTAGSVAEKSRPCRKAW